MRYISILLASLLTIGCGTGVKDPPGGALKTSQFSPPAITTLTPDTVPIDSVPFTMTVNGSNFGTDALVFWNGAPLSTKFVSGTQLMAALTASDLMLRGRIPVYVLTGGLNSNTVVFNLSQ